MHVAEPWERRCGACDGSGLVMSLAWAAWHEEYANLERITDLPTRLHALGEHIRRAPTEVETVVCPACGGEGVVMTEMGAALLDFINRRLEPRPTPPTWDGGHDDAAASYVERPTQQSVAPEPPSPAAAMAATPDWGLHAPPNAVATRDLAAQSNGPPARGRGDQWRSRPRPEWRSDEWD